MTWTAERVTDLKTRWAGGQSASTIATAMGNISRSAVLGKIHRMGMSTPRPAVQKARKENQQKRIEQGWVPYGKKQYLYPPPATRVRPKPWQIPVEATEPPPDQSDCAVTLIELESRHCRWPLGEGPAKLFCGANKLDGHSYCPRHCRMAYRGSPPRITDDERARRSTHWRKITRAYKADTVKHIKDAA